MTKFIATLGLRLLNALGIIALAKAIHNAINGNVNFATPPSLSAFQTATNETETAVNDVAAAKANLATKVAIQEAKLKVLKDLMRAMAKYVDIIANGDKAIIESAAMTAGNQASPIHLGQVENLSLSHGNDAGEVDTHWNMVAKSDNYNIETSPTAPNNIGVAPWVHYAIVSKSSHTLTGFTSGSQLWVRVRANGGADAYGAWSDPAVIIVP